MSIQGNKHWKVNEALTAVFAASNMFCNYCMI